MLGIWPQVRTERGVLPREHPDRVAGRLDAAIASVGAGRLDDAAATLSAVMEDEERWLYQVGQGCNTSQELLCVC
jgi:hypothetical protein